MKQITGVLVLIFVLWACMIKKPGKENQMKTISNPVNISYRFQLDEPSRREAADPTIVFFQNEYYLFASKSGGYWYSADLTDWTFVSTDQIPTEQYAPTALVIDDTMYFMASSNMIYKAIDLKAGKWELAATLPFPVVDPALFLDDDKNLYFYWGCSDKDPIYGIRLDYQANFKPIGEKVPLIFANTEENGWEVPGDYSTLTGNAPWIEGSWMNKRNGIYYLQYAGPGTQFKSYADGVYTSVHPLGPFKLAENNPFAYKPEGFVTGAGHGSTFKDKYGNFWHTGTVTISQKHMFERRLAIFPTFFDDAGVLYTDTRFGDYPMMVPSKKVEDAGELFPGWMLLSYKKAVTVSSVVEGFDKENMTDEDIRTYWAAKSGNKDEWAMIDLGNSYDVKAVQINFAEYGAAVFDREPGLKYQYSVEASSNGTDWKTIIDQSQSTTDLSHAYFQLNDKASCRYLKIQNYQVPGGSFALSGFRVFGTGKGARPIAANGFSAIRDAENKRTVHLSWKPSKKATGYLIRYGNTNEKLYHSYMVYENNSVTINTLDTRQDYYFAIDVFNENGITTGTDILKVN